MAPREQRSRRGSAGATAVALLALAAPFGFAAQDDGRLAPEEVKEIDRMLRRGELRDAFDILDEVLEEVPGDAAARTLRARARFERCEYEDALADAERAFRDALTVEPTPERPADRELLAETARRYAHMLVELGRAAEALTVLGEAGGSLIPEADSRDAWAVGRARLEAGDGEAADGLFRQGAEAPGPRTWQGFLARARCQRALGFFQRAARSLVEADKLATKDDGTEPDVLAELGDVYFEAYGEVDDAMSLQHLPSKQYREALTLHPDHEAARLGLFEIYRFNWALSRESPAELLKEALAARPLSIRALLASVSSDLDDGRLMYARRALDKLEEVAPARRDVRSERAALAWIEHDREGAEAILADLVAADPTDSRPERVVARHLNEIYRFQEALPFARRATERDGKDWLAWTEYGRALANTGAEDEAREAFAKAEHAAEGRQNAWRKNTARILGKISGEFTEHDAGEHTFVWLPDAEEILRTYLEPFYAEHRTGLAERYGHTPGPVRIEIFRRWSDFSVRSTGFAGFSALGVCFGPVVTAVSPLSELRGNFSWARTAYHEYTHVVHLSLSHNRCPRWITEGLATWEEEEKNPAWSRNMRGDLVNAYANEMVIPVRDLNRAFRGPRILFAYYQGGLLCRMLIEEYGFAPMIRLLLAFDKGRDLDQAFDEVFGLTPEEVDARFLAFVREKVEPLRIEPYWSPQRVLKKRLSLAKSAPEDPAERAAWAEDWLTVAWGYLQQEKRIDAEQALRVVQTAGELPPRGHFLKGELALVRTDLDEARASYARGLELGGEDYRVRMTLADLALADGDHETAEAHLLAAERAFPGIAAPMPSAELKLAELYAMRGDEEKSMEARIRWLAYNAGDVDVRLQVAKWLDGLGRHAESAELYREANEVDPFRRDLHRRWGIALAVLGRYEEALREFDVALKVPAELDAALIGGAHADVVIPEQFSELISAAEGHGLSRADWEALAPEILGRKARVLVELGRPEEARAAAEEALALDPDAGIAQEVLSGL